eukprot:m.338979 g.338979  ORF g.338979 m.338979 type:complete len:201 (+) comp16089_c0_seq6:370-972(+)
MLFSFDMGLYFAVFAVLVFAALVYMGWFQAIRFIEIDFMPCYLYGFTFIGPNDQNVKLFNKLKKILRETGLDKIKMGIGGLYHDDPRYTDSDKCRCFVFVQFKERLPPMMERTLFNHDMKLRYVHEPIRCYSTIFPFRNWFSYIIGPLAVYYRMNKQTCPKVASADIMETGSCELYNDEQGYIQYLLPFSFHGHHFQWVE